MAVHHIAAYRHVSRRPIRTSVDMLRDGDVEVTQDPTFDWSLPMFDFPCSRVFRDWDLHQLGQAPVSSSVTDEITDLQRRLDRLAQHNASLLTKQPERYPDPSQGPRLRLYQST
jgi:hypothetical protein